MKLASNLILIGAALVIIGIWTKYGFVSAIIAVGVAIIWFAIGLNLSAREKAATQRQKEIQGRRTELQERINSSRWN